MHYFNAAITAFAKAGDLVIGKRRMPAIDMTNDIGIGFENHILVNQP